MAKTAFADVDAYLAAQPPKTRAALVRVRRVLREALPGADEVISYQIPGYRLGGRVVLHFAGWKQHYSIYPVTDAVEQVLREAFDGAGHEIRGKTLRFSLAEPVPEALIRRVAETRAAEDCDG